MILQKRQNLSATCKTNFVKTFWWHEIWADFGKMLTKIHLTFRENFAKKFRFLESFLCANMHKSKSARQLENIAVFPKFYYFREHFRKRGKRLVIFATMKMFGRLSQNLWKFENNIFLRNLVKIHEISQFCDNEKAFSFRP